MEVKVLEYRDDDARMEALRAATHGSGDAAEDGGSYVKKLGCEEKQESRLKSLIRLRQDALDDECDDEVLRLTHQIKALRPKTKTESSRQLPTRTEDSEADLRVWFPGSLAQLGDCLRCTIECATGDDVWDTYDRIRSKFDIRPENGRVKNNMSPDVNNMKSKNPIPPDMLLNIVLQPAGDITYPLVAEVQIHLAAINTLKHESHILYEIRRAVSVFMLQF
jgi:hypothetical protein